ncbi:hypothetical protein B0681_08300 [Moraxella porci DSM 25326]|uniref:Uncharacterized protein n=1 Tax=Moraxella porci DSM 25326 TaxID=573983 RepID=A0A1T0CNR1_9GAMM|nr:hypothetical protein B0681_08300 [Moraxella porci DSM 25326]
MPKNHKKCTFVLTNPSIFQIVTKLQEHLVFLQRFICLKTLSHPCYLDANGVHYAVIALIFDAN